MPVSETALLIDLWRGRAKRLRLNGDWHSEQPSWARGLSEGQRHAYAECLEWVAIELAHALETERQDAVIAKRAAPALTPFANRA